MDIEKVFKKVLDCAFLVHSALGPGLLESAYQECLSYELSLEGLKVEKSLINHKGTQRIFPKGTKI